MTSDVRPLGVWRRARWTAASDSESEMRGGLVEDDDVGCLQHQSALGPRRCFSPPERRWPLSPIDRGSSPSGELGHQMAAIWACSRAARTSVLGGASGRAYIRLDRRVSWKR